MFEYENRIIAFVDILGFKELVKNENKMNLIYSILTVLKIQEKAEHWDLSLMEIEEDAQYKSVETFDIRDSIQCTCFSDSIVISVKYDDDNINEMTSSVIAHISRIGAQLISYGILIRGGMTIGKLYHNNGILLGQGMIEAYEIESKLAKMPRIAISKKLVDCLNYPLKGKAHRYPYHQYLKRFSDGVVGFSQLQSFEVLQSSTIIEEDEMHDYLDEVRKVIIKGLDSNMENPDVFSKYVWLKDQYNNELYVLEKDGKKRLPELNEERPYHNIHFSVTDKSINREK